MTLSLAWARARIAAHALGQGRDAGASRCSRSLCACVPRLSPCSQVGLPENHTMEQWVTAMAETFRVQEFEARVAAEAEARRRELRRMEKRKKAFDQVLAVERRKVRARAARFRGDARRVMKQRGAPASTRRLGRRAASTRQRACVG